MVSVNRPAARIKSARIATQDHRRPSRTARDPTQEQVEHLSDRAADCARDGLDKAQQVERTFAQYVREQPLKSVLIAAGVGLVLGRFWMRR
jgi:ElaB/YqjD/DUF883 family membrane-anchored ribosome-binding protein